MTPTDPRIISIHQDRGNASMKKIINYHSFLFIFWETMNILLGIKMDKESKCILLHLSSSEKA